VNSKIYNLQQKALQRLIDTDDAMELYEEGTRNPFLLMALASEIRESCKGKRVSLCSIVNAKSGVCPENCRFCAQSAHYETGAPTYPLISAPEMIEKARLAKEWGAHFFGIVTSGTSIESEGEWTAIYQAIEGMNRIGIRPCGSLGMLNKEQAKRLKEAGLFRYHHNLETSRSFFPNICSTHEYEEDIETNRTAKDAGLSVCCGGIIGLGETIAHRIELAMTLREIDVDSVPINILNPIAGTPLVNTPPLSPIEILITIAIFRFVLPDKDIKLCGGKETNLRQLLPFAMVAGANSFMTGDYLTTAGRDASHDLEMIKDLGFCPSEE
jgi:biotin synthase